MTDSNCIDKNYKAKLFPEGDWQGNTSDKDKKGNAYHKFIQEWKFDNDKELNSYLAKAKQAIDFVNTGNNGRRFDYDLCKTDECFGTNSNTVQKLIFEKMNIKLNIPKDVSLAGIKGKFYDGLIDNALEKLGEELQKEQP